MTLPPFSLPAKAGLAAAVLALIIADQISKWWVLERMVRLEAFNAEGPSMDFIPWLVTTGQSQLPPYRHEVTSFFDIVMAWNTGVSFSLFSSDHAVMVYVLIGIGLLLSSVFAGWMMVTRSFCTAIPLAMIVGGALSNVWDRVRFGAVADFLYFHIGIYGWPAFNLADSCIVTGVAFLALDSLFLEPKRNKGQTA